MTVFAENYAVRQLSSFLRYFAVLPAIACILSALFLIVCTSVLTITTIFNSARTLFATGLELKQLEQAIITFVQLADYLLISTIILTIGIGLYELSVSKLGIPQWLEVDRIDDFKPKLIGAVITAISVEFLAKGLAGGVEVLSFGGGIAVVIACLSLYLYLSKHKFEFSKMVEKSRK